MKEEQIVPQFKVGDKVWYWSLSENCPVEWEITDEWTIEGNQAKKPYHYTKEGRPCSYLVKTFFSTKEECANSVLIENMSRFNEKLSSCVERIKELHKEIEEEVDEILEIQKRVTQTKLNFLKKYGIESN